MLRPDGHSDFAALRTKRGAGEPPSSPSIFCRLTARTGASSPLRSAALSWSRSSPEIDAIAFSEAIDAEGALVFEKACEMGLEGIVSKRLGGVYSSGPCRNWVKVKNPAFSRK